MDQGKGREAQRDRRLREEGVELLAEYAADSASTADALRRFARDLFGQRP